MLEGRIRVLQAVAALLLIMGWALRWHAWIVISFGVAEFASIVAGDVVTRSGMRRDQVREILRSG